MVHPAAGVVTIDSQTYELQPFDDDNGARLKVEIPMSAFGSLSNVQIEVWSEQLGELFDDEFTMPEF